MPSSEKEISNRLKKALNRISEMSNFEKNVIEDLKSIPTLKGTLEDADEITPIQAPAKDVFTDEKAPVLEGHVVTEKGEYAVASVQPLDNGNKPIAQASVSPEPAVAPPTKRVDYLAGLTAVACIAVTLHHFGQTFW